MSGYPASPGVVVAPVFRIPAGGAGEDFADGAVLVAHSTDPTMVRAMLKASALVTEIGGPMCHTAIVAIELGIPCVVAVREAMTRLRDGMVVKVNGDLGTVSLVDDE